MISAAAQTALQAWTELSVGSAAAATHQVRGREAERMVIIILIKKTPQAVNRTLKGGCARNVLANEEPEEEVKCLHRNVAAPESHSGAAPVHTVHKAGKTLSDARIRRTIRLWIWFQCHHFGFLSFGGFQSLKKCGCLTNFSFSGTIKFTMALAATGRMTLRVR